MNTKSIVQIMAFVGVLTLYLIWSAKTEMGTKRSKKK